MIVLVVIFSRSSFDKRHSPIKIIVYSLTQTLFVLVGGILSSFVLLWVIAFLHLTIFSIILNSKPGLLGVVSDTKTIAERLGGDYRNSKIVIADSTEQTPLVALAKTTSGEDNFYGKYLLSAIPQSVIFPVQSDTPSMMLLDGTLIITKADQSQLETLSPVIAYLLVKQYFPTRDIKFYPKLSFMTKEMFAKYRLEDENEQLASINLELDTIQGMVSSLSASLKENPRQERSIKELLSEYQDYQTYFTSQKKRIEQETNHVPNELGVFREPNTIQIIYNPSVNSAANMVSIGQGSLSLIDYFEILVHEYLHYASFISNKDRFTNSFFEEALTEYFARNIIKQSFSLDTNIGYPLQVRIFHEMTKMYTDSELADLYFTKNETALAAAIDRDYGDNFYEDNYVMFQTLMYTASPIQAVDVGNTIMKKIGGGKLTRKDLLSN